MLSVHQEQHVAVVLVSGKQDRPRGVDANVGKGRTVLVWLVHPHGTIRTVRWVAGLFLWV